MSLSCNCILAQVRLSVCRKFKDAIGKGAVGYTGEYKGEVQEEKRLIV